jgi:hypothetical protein
MRHTVSDPTQVHTVTVFHFDVSYLAGLVTGFHVVEVLR